VRQVGCGKGLVRQCLADMKAEEELETFFIEQIDQQVYIMYLSAVLRIRDVYPGSRIQIFTHPGSKNSNKREG
jgi:hypothetical protein